MLTCVNREKSQRHQRQIQHEQDKHKLFLAQLEFHDKKREIVHRKFRAQFVSLKEDHQRMIQQKWLQRKQEQYQRQQLLQLPVVRSKQPLYKRMALHYEKSVVLPLMQDEQRELTMRRQLYGCRVSSEELDAHERQYMAQVDLRRELLKQKALERKQQWKELHSSATLDSTIFRQRVSFVCK